MKEEIKDILNDLKDSAENPSYTEIDAFSDEAYEVPNYFTLDPTNGGSKTLLNYIENLQSQLKAKEELIEEAISHIRDCCNMDSKWVNLHFDYAQNGMSENQVDDLLEILSKGENNG